MTLIWSPEALEDLETIFDYIVKENPAAAVSMLERIESSVEELRDHPSLGRPGSVAGTRELVVPGTAYIVAYELGRKDRAVHLLAVRHGARLWPESFS